LKENLCTVYEHRPLSCRGVNSTRVDSCIEIFNQTKAPDSRESIPQQDAAADAVTFGQRSALFFQALDNRLVDLGRAMQVLMESDASWQNYLEGRDELVNAKIVLSDPFQSPDIQRAIQPAFKTDREKSEPAGESTKIDLAFVSEFWNLFSGQGEFHRAMKTLRGGSAAEWIAKMQVPSAYESEEAILEWRNHAVAAQREFAASNVNAHDAFNALSMHVPLRYSYAGLDDKAFMKEHNEILFTNIAAKLFPDLVEPIDPKPLKGRKLRVGYLSQHIRYHNGARWALGWIQNHGEDIETFVFNVGFGEDAISRKFQQEADHYFFLTRSVPENARFIKSLDLDVLIMTDAQAASRNTQYSLFRLAPAQCCAWGSPVTAGSPTLDYYLSSELMEPENAQSQYNEKLILLPNSGLCYQRFSKDPIAATTREHYGIPAGKPFIYLAQSPMKMLPQFDHLYEEITDRLDAPIVLHEAKPATTKIVKRRLEKAGVRTHWIPFVKRPDFLRLMQLCDLSLDTPMWSGGNTTIDALAFGKPVVTLAGPYMRSRHSVAFVKLAGVDDLIAKDQQDYISLATDFDRQRAAMTNLNADALFEDKECVHALDDFLRQVLSA